MKIRQRPIQGTAVVNRIRHRVETRSGALTAYPGDLIIDMHGVPMVLSQHDFEKLFTVVDDDEKTEPAPDETGPAEEIEP